MKKRLFAMAFFLVALTVYTYALRFRGGESVAAASIGGLPRVLAGYEATDQPVEPDVVELLGADELILREYRRAEMPPVWLFMGYFAQPKENSQIHSPKHCYPGTGWSIYDESTLALVLGDETVDAKRLLINNGRYSRVVVYWFHTATGIVTNEYALKLDQVRNALLGKSQSSAFIRFSTPFDEQAGPAEATAELTGFVEAMAPYLTRVFSGDNNS